MCPVMPPDARRRETPPKRDRWAQHGRQILWGFLRNYTSGYSIKAKKFLYINANPKVFNPLTCYLIKLAALLAMVYTVIVGLSYRI